MSPPSPALSRRLTGGPSTLSPFASSPGDQAIEHHRPGPRRPVALLRMSHRGQSPDVTRRTRRAPAGVNPSGRGGAPQRSFAERTALILAGVEYPIDTRGRALGSTTMRQLLLRGRTRDADVAFQRASDPRHRTGGEAGTPSQGVVRVLLRGPGAVCLRRPGAAGAPTLLPPDDLEPHGVPTPRPQGGGGPPKPPKNRTHRPLLTTEPHK